MTDQSLLSFLLHVGYSSCWEYWLLFLPGALHGVFTLLLLQRFNFTQQSTGSHPMPKWLWRKHLLWHRSEHSLAWEWLQSSWLSKPLPCTSSTSKNCHQLCHQISEHWINICHAFCINLIYWKRNLGYFKLPILTCTNALRCWSTKTPAHVDCVGCWTVPFFVSGIRATRFSISQVRSLHA